MGAHNVSPRALHRLPTRLLDILARILAACERLGRWPHCLAMVLIVLVLLGQKKIMVLGLQESPVLPRGEGPGLLQ